ncbi:MAG TPA: aldehyde dehydrogenase family protein, partial [Candidatus Kapabacteria bacterium]|nr:aldehyde dehydrogenase family protein [Candidatus Kapabacteria bacterium]
IEQINRTGFGLTLGVHSRINRFCESVTKKAQVGNVYINRNMIGATVGSQPFGGQDLSGTGPKAGGPHYLLRLANEKTVSINTAAIGGNTRLLTED